jgi:hypothetical protein
MLTFLRAELFILVERISIRTSNRCGLRRDFASAWIFPIMGNDRFNFLIDSITCKLSREVYLQCYCEYEICLEFILTSSKRTLLPKPASLHDVVATASHAHRFTTYLLYYSPFALSFHQKGQLLGSPSSVSRVTINNEIQFHLHIPQSQSPHSQSRCIINMLDSS